MIVAVVVVVVIVIVAAVMASVLMNTGDDSGGDGGPGPGGDTVKRFLNYVDNGDFEEAVVMFMDQDGNFADPDDDWAENTVEDWEDEMDDDGSDFTIESLEIVSSTNTHYQAEETGDIHVVRYIIDFEWDDHDDGEFVRYFFTAQNLDEGQWGIRDDPFDVGNYDEDEYEDNDDPDDASEIRLGNTLDGLSMHDWDDEDWFTFTLTEDTDDVVIETGGAYGDTVIYLYEDIDDAEDLSDAIEYNDDDEDAAGTFSRIEADLDDGEYWVRVVYYDYYYYSGDREYYDSISEDSFDYEGLMYYELLLYEDT
jgi:hypothetical protein